MLLEMIFLISKLRVSHTPSFDELFQKWHEFDCQEAHNPRNYARTNQYCCETGGMYGWVKQGKTKTRLSNVQGSWLRIWLTRHITYLTHRMSDKHYYYCPFYGRESLSLGWDLCFFSKYIMGISCLFVLTLMGSYRKAYYTNIETVCVCGGRGGKFGYEKCDPWHGMGAGRYHQLMFTLKGSGVKV